MADLRRSRSGQTFAQTDTLRLMVNYGRKEGQRDLTADFGDRGQFTHNGDRLLCRLKPL